MFVSGLCIDDVDPERSKHPIDASFGAHRLTILNPTTDDSMEHDMAESDRTHMHTGKRRSFDEARL